MPDKLKDEPTTALEIEESALSHKQLRKLKRKRERGEVGVADESSLPKPKKSKAEKDKVDPAAASTKRENSIWVGNLAYKTTQDDLRTFFDGTGEITRINMPKGPIKGSAVKRENSGYAYVDFATEDAKVIAISLSEQNLHGRRLLIKDGSNFEGSKSATAVLASVTEGKTVSLTKTSRRILASQKESPCPVLFMGNLGYEATKEQIREMLLHHMQLKGKKGTDQKTAKSITVATTATGDNESDKDASAIEGNDNHPNSTMKTTKSTPKPLLSFEPTATTTATTNDPPSLKNHKPRDSNKSEEKIPSATSELGLRKIRLFTFPDTGKCKGFCFLDFESTAHATAALIHPGNHHWNNRDLILQYASLDAVRRGGYPEADGKRVFVKGSQRGAVDAEVISTRLEAVDGPSTGSNSEDKASERLGGWQAKDNGQVSAKPQSSIRRGPTGGRVKQQRPRPKPGAALAAAQRATAGIVPGQGTKVKFN
ncbi:hypothetical protein FRB95_011370 [Tulasnella sp. JGI-2019a]|nr:hypothetical protein FRB95_011370 [Tulasnella sp. JGI-2019a]